jgi:hypothetical protein
MISLEFLFLSFAQEILHTVQKLETILRLKKKNSGKIKLILHTMCKNGTFFFGNLKLKAQHN